MFRNIQSVSIYERRVLFRSWFFRIFALLALLFLVGINIGFYGNHAGAQWTTRAISANLPYINILFINIAQAVIAVFMASEFLRRDNKLDTTEVIYTRPVSNGEYVVGKTLGIIMLFSLLVIGALIISLVFNLVRMDTTVAWATYLYYPFLITIPTLVYILGLCFFLMILSKSQAVTFVILLGYIGLTLFYFKGTHDGLLDYMAFNLPMVYSDFIGFTGIHKILLHRFAYLFLGIGFIFGTIYFLKRLPQTGKLNSFNLFGFLLFLFLGGFLGYRYYEINRQEHSDRERYLEYNNEYAREPVADIISNDISLTQFERNLVISSELVIRNPSGHRMDTVVLSLNPGFTIDSITTIRGRIEYKTKGQILLVIPEYGLIPGRQIRIVLYYSGTPDETIAVIDIPEEQLEARKAIQVAKIEKKPAIISKDFLLLTQELLWYPIAGTGFNTSRFLPCKPDFVRFTLTVMPGNNLVPVAPGRVEKRGAAYHFYPEVDLSALTLVAGPFIRKDININGTEYNLFLKEGHDFFSNYFSSILDTLPALIAGEKNNYEQGELDLYYPFRRLNLVEVPIQFHAYERPYTQITANLQPEMVLIPEKGAGLASLDFKRYSIWESRFSRGRENERSQEEIETDRFKRFLQTTFFNNDNGIRSMSRGSGGVAFSLIDFQGDYKYTRNPYCLFPLYFNFITAVTSDDYPMFNSMLEVYLKEGFEVLPFQSFSGGLTDTERANLALRHHSVTEILEQQTPAIVSALIEQTASYIILAIKNRIGAVNFDNFLYYYIEDHSFNEIPLEQFARDFRNEFEVDILDYFEILNTDGNIPEFMISEPEYIQSRDEIGDVYLVRFSVSNTGKVKGLVDVTLRLSGMGGFGGGGEASSEKRMYEIEPGTTKEIQIALFEAPRMMTLNTLISGNIPSAYSTFLRSAIVNYNTETGDYERITEKMSRGRAEEEYLVDNEDAGFEYVSVSNESRIKQFIDSRKEKEDEIIYESLNPWTTPAVWTPVAHSALFGATVRSAMVSSGGNGSNLARWKVKLSESGFYDVYAYIPLSAMMNRVPGRRRQENQGEMRESREGFGGRFRSPRSNNQGIEYHYKIITGAGSEDIVFSLSNAEEGWNKIGTFYLPPDTVTIELSNETNGNRVIADAVKWVRKPR